MKVDEAREFAKSLNAAADAAEAAGKDLISDADLITHLQAADDAARSELLDAINSAKSE